METIKLTKKDFNGKNEFIGDESILDFNGNLEIEENLGIVFFKYLNIKGYIYAKAGSGITAGWGITAGLEITAGWGINCKLKLSAKLRIFAGLCIWREPTKEEQQIICGKLESGKICFGELIEIGLPEETMTIKHIRQKSLNKV